MSYSTSDTSTFLNRDGLFDGVISRRLLSYLVDLVILAVLHVIVGAIIFVLGFLTLGLAWLIFLIFTPFIIGTYLVFTLGGPAAATPGMAMNGIQLRLYDGATVGPLGALGHGLLFYISVSLLTPLILLIGLITSRNRLLHDIILGTYVVRSNRI